MPAWFFPADSSIFINFKGFLASLRKSTAKHQTNKSHCIVILKDWEKIILSLLEISLKK